MLRLALQLLSRKPTELAGSGLVGRAICATSNCAVWNNQSRTVITAGLIRALSQSRVTARLERASTIVLAQWIGVWGGSSLEAATAPADLQQLLSQTLVKHAGSLQYAAEARACAVASVLLLKDIGVRLGPTVCAGLVAAAVGAVVAAGRGTAGGNSMPQLVAATELEEYVASELRCWTATGDRMQ